MDHFGGVFSFSKHYWGLLGFSYYDTKETPICPYVFHMYHAHELLLLIEKKEYRIAEALLKHNIEPKEGEPEASEESEHESLSSQETREIQAQENNRMKKSPQNKRRSLAGKGPTQQLGALATQELIEPNYHTIIDNVKIIWARELAEANIIREACKELRNCKPEQLVAAINNLPTRKKINKLEAKNSFLLGKANKLKGEFDDQKK